jgi:hypothetical protein
MPVLYGFLAYAAVGLAVAAIFVLRGVTRVTDPPRPVSIGARLLILPGAAVLWPYVLARWLRLGGRP